MKHACNTAMPMASTVGGGGGAGGTQPIFR